MVKRKNSQARKKYSAQDLCIKVTGEKLNFNFFKKYAINKYTSMYDL